jgi:predicted dehydrogenase
VNSKRKSNSVDVLYRNGANRQNGSRQPPPISFVSAAGVVKKSPRLRVGVVGCGYWGSKHARILSCMPEVSRVAVIDPDARARAKIVASFPASTPYHDLDTALPHVDAVIVATPPQTHCDVALKCLRAGKHVLLEKPIAKSMSEALLVVEEARRSNLTLMPGHTFEFNPAVHELKRRIVEGELGRIHYIHSSRLNLGLYRPVVNVVWDLAPHDISIMNYLLDSVPNTVAGWASLNAGETEDVAFIRLEYRELGVTGFAHLSWLDPKKTREVTVVGSKKMAVYNDLVEEQLRIFDRGVIRPEESSSFERPLSCRYGDIISPRIDFKEPLALEVEHFIYCVQRGISPRTDGEDGLTVIAVLETIDQAIATGAVVNVRYPARETCAPQPISSYALTA